jgi:hypothetical protein
MIDPQSDPQLNHELPKVRRSRVTIDEALVICRSTMTQEESDRLDAETPPFVPETRNGRMTYREDGKVDWTVRPAFDPA